MYWLITLGSGVVSCLIILRIYLKLSWKRFKEDVDMTGKTTIITGANSGLGKALAIEFARRRARVIMACRSAERAMSARQDVLKLSGCDEEQIVIRILNLGSLQSVREFAEKINKEEERLDILVNNAGINSCNITNTGDGLEMTYQTNHFSPFLLTLLLLDLIKRSGPGGRIVNLGSYSHLAADLNLDYVDPDKTRFFMENLQTGWIRRKSPMVLYQNSKLMNVMFTFELARRLAKSYITVNCVHPGFVKTAMIQKEDRLLNIIVLRCLMIIFKSEEEGVQPILHCALSRRLRNVTGKYFGNFETEKYHKMADDLGLCEKLWEISEKAVGISFDRVNIDDEK